MTNDSRRAPEEYVRKLWRLGVQASLEEVVTVGSALQHVLAERPRRDAYVIGSDGRVSSRRRRRPADRQREPRETEAQLVVVAGHDAFAYTELRAATRAVLGGAEMVAAGRDATFPAADGPSPGTGAVVAALEYATGQRAHSVGKPEPQLFLTALDRLGPGRTLAVGDRLDSDLAGAHAAGIDGAIVLSGVTDAAEAEAAEDPAPVAVAADLRALVVA